MPFLKKPKFLIIGGALLVAVVLAVILLFMPRGATIGFYGLEQNAEETIRLQERLAEKGYSIYFAQTLQDLEDTDCNAWVIQTSSDVFAEKILSIVGEKAVFIGQKPSLSQTVRYAGLDMVQAGEQLADLLTRLPNHGDTNENGTVSCLLLTAPEGYKEKTDFEQGLYGKLEENAQPYVVLDTLSCSLTVEAGTQSTLASLSAYGRDIEVIFAASEVLATGAAQAIKEGGWEISRDLYLLALGHTDDSITALNEQQRSGLVFASWEEIEDLVLDAVADAVDGCAPKEYLLPFRIFTNASPLQ